MDAAEEDLASAGYDELVRAQKFCGRCRGVLRNPSETSADGHDLAHFDTDEVGPWSAWIGARPAKLLLVGQDWGTVAYYLENKGQDAPRISANVRLLDRLAEIGVYEPDLEWGNAFRIPIFLTNAVLCLKTTDSMSGPVRARCLWNCHPFLRATVRVTGAEAIVAMGQAALTALFGAFGARLPRPFAEVVEEGSPIELPGAPPIFAVYHPSVRPLNRDLEAQRRDWARVGDGLRGRGLLSPSTVPGVSAA